MVFFSDVSGLLTSDGGDMGMVGGWVKVISGEVSNGTVISGESPPMSGVTVRKVWTMNGMIFCSETKWTMNGMMNQKSSETK